MKLHRLKPTAAVLGALLALSGCRTTVVHSQNSDNIPKGARILHYDYAGGRNVRTIAFDGGIACQAMECSAP